jgi:hypothetical protein
MTIPQFVVAIAALTFGVAASAPPAAAAITSSAVIGGGPMDPQAHFANFDNLSLGNAGGTSGGVSVSFAGGGIAVTGTTGTYTAPYITNSNGALFGDSMVSGFETTPYLTTVLGTVTLTFAQAQNYLGLLWGSLDPFNTLDFYNGATQVAHLTGRDVVPINMGDIGPNGTFYVNLLSSMPFTSVVAASGGYSFEFDNVAYAFEMPDVASAPVPEPFSVSLLAAGLLALGYVVAARRSARRM